MMNYKQSSLKHRFVKQSQTSNPFETSPKSQDIEPISMPEIGWIQDQIWKNWTTNPAMFLLKIWTKFPIPPEHLVYRSVAKAPGENQPIFCFVLHGRTPSNRPIATVELQNSSSKKILKILFSKIYRHTTRIFFYCNVGKRGSKIAELEAMLS